jgi:excinuclease ABC subunit C
MVTEEYQKLAPKIPHQPGVYKFIDKSDTIIYVGKAKNLKKRLSSYFGEKKNQAFKTRTMVKNADHFEYIVVDTEHDALLLENTLIKRLQPRYNVNLKDGKSYTYICIKKERFPRVFFTRKVIRDGSVYFGPYTSKFKAKQLMEVVRKLFQLRTCKFNLSEANIDAGKFKVCLEYHIKNCKGPCEDMETEEAYNSKIDQIKNILKGQVKPVKDYLKEQMAIQVETLQFESAQMTKERLSYLEEYHSKSSVVSHTIKDLDVFSILNQEDYAYINYLKIINGALINSDTVELKKNLNDNQKDLMTFGVQFLRDKFNSIAPEIVSPFEVNLLDDSVIQTIPQRGEKKKLLELAQKNLTYFALQKKKEILNKKNKQTSAERILKTLQSDLQMEKLPFHIECFDNSNIQGTHPVASCVVFKNAKPSKKDYRKYNIKTVVGPDDFASMEEVVSRRYKRLLKDEEPLPDLVIIDGGKGQLSSAHRIFRELGIENKVTLIGIAKRLEEIYFPTDPIPIYINKKSESLRLIQHARNEAHRFAINFHRDQRSKNFTRSELLDIPGIGSKTVEKLLKAFGSVKKIKESTDQELIKVAGPSVSKKIRAYFSVDE